MSCADRLQANTGKRRFRELSARNLKHFCRSRLQPRQKWPRSNGALTPEAPSSQSVARGFDSNTKAVERAQILAVSFLLSVGGINHKLSAVTGAFTHRANTLRARQFQMNQTAFSRRHRIKTKWLAGFANSLRGHPR